MISIILCFAITMGTGYVGYVFSCYYKKRYKFYLDFIDFLNHAKTQISCFQTRLSNIFTTFNASGSDLEKLVRSFDKDLENMACKRFSYLTDSEWEFVTRTLGNIGKVDVDNEIYNIEAIKLKVEALKQTTKTECERKSSLCIKLGVALGILISIIII